MLRRDRFDELAVGGPASIVDAFLAADVRGLAARSIGMGAQIVVIKCGHVGAYLRTARDVSGSHATRLLARPGEWNDVEQFEPTCRVEHIVSATGSGDSSIAGFLAAMLRGEGPARCMAALTVVGAQNLSAIDTVSGVLSWEETLAQLEAGPEKNPVPERLAGIGR